MDKIAQQQQLITELTAKLKEQNEALASLLSQPAKIGTIAAGPASADDHLRWTVNIGNEQFIVRTAKRRMEGIPLDPKKIKHGDLVSLMPTEAGMGIYEIVPAELRSVYGTVETVLEAPKDGVIVVDRSGVRVRLQSVLNDINPGDEVVVANQVAIQIARRKPDMFAESFRAVEWDEIGGHDKPKQLIRRAIDAATSRSSLGVRYKIQPPRGILLEGPPGNGKTMLARAALTHLASRYGGEALGSAYIYVSGPELLHWYVGSTEFAIRQLFDKARRHYVEHEYPALLVIDEAEALLPIRGSRKSSDVDSTIVPTFLSEMDGFKKGSPIVMLMTNLANRIDPAVLREGRVDVRIHIPRPDRDNAARIARIYLGEYPVNHDTDLDCLVNAVVDQIYTSELVDSVSGAMIASVAMAAASVAMQRDEVAGVDTPSGVCVEDIPAALAQLRSTTGERSIYAD